MQAQSTRLALTGFLLSGLLITVLGAVLPAWGYHIHSEYRVIGSYFLCLGLGNVASNLCSHQLLRWRGLRFVLVLACAISCGALLTLAAVGPPAPDWQRMAGLFSLGFGQGLLNVGLLVAISPSYKQDPAATINLSGANFGLGCLITALLVSGTFYIYTTGAILILIATVPGFFAGLFARSRISSDSLQAQLPLSQAWQDFRSPAAVLFTLLLFFQFGNEWALAGWLPLFLVQRAGMSPSAGLLLLAVYFLALLIGRVAVQAILPTVNHGKLLMGSIVAAILGCVILGFTDNRFGSVMGILFLGAGFASIYPLVVEKVGNRFPYYHPGLFNGLLSFAFMGGLLAPWTLGFFTDMWGIRAVMALPLLGSCMVFILLLLILLEARLSGVEDSAD